jgi:hypothetical protein
MTIVSRGVRRMAMAVAVIGAVATALTWTATAASSAAAPTAATLSVAASVPKCSASDLGVWVAADQGQGAAGTIATPLEFTNVSHHTCTLYGFPGVSALSTTGQQLGSPANRDHSVKPRLVKLAPGGTGYALLEFSDVITGNCPPSSKRLAVMLQVYPPDQRAADHAFWSATACIAKGQTNFLRVRVIAPGIGVRGSIG